MKIVCLVVNSGCVTSSRYASRASRGSWRMNATKMLVQSTTKRTVARMISNTPARTIGQLSCVLSRLRLSTRSYPHTQNRHRKTPDKAMSEHCR